MGYAIMGSAKKKKKKLHGSIHKHKLWFTAAHSSSLIPCVFSVQNIRTPINSTC